MAIQLIKVLNIECKQWKITTTSVKEMQILSESLLQYIYYQAVGTIWRALSKPPQRRQGPDPRPLWLLVGTPSAFGPELAYRLRVARALFDGCPYIFLIYYYITIYVCVIHFYYLSALVCCWSSVSIRTIIYKFLNVCPFDYMAVAVSGKVERS